MITLRARIIVIAIMALALLEIISLIRKKRLELKYSLPWLVLGTLLILAVAIPSFLTWLAGVMGIYDTTNMVFFLGFVFVLILDFTMTMSLSRNSERVRKLTQQLAINEYKEKNDKEE